MSLEKFEQGALAEKRMKEKEAFLEEQLESEERRKEEGASIEAVTEEQAKQIEKDIEDVSQERNPIYTLSSSANLTWR